MSYESMHIVLIRTPVFYVCVRTIQKKKFTHALKRQVVAVVKVTLTAEI